MAKKSEKKYWRSLADYNNNKELKKIEQNEFLKGVTDKFAPEEMEGISRRKFMALLAASAAFATTACSDYRDKGEIIPYNKRPEEIRPGTANYYASTCTGCEMHCGILIKTREGRPIKVDGNPEHPVNKGKICAIGQSLILDLYDPDRIQEPLFEGMRSDWTSADQKIISELKKAAEKNQEIAIITNPVFSPSVQKLFSELQVKYPTLNIYTYKHFNTSNREQALEKNFGTQNIPVYRFDKADIVVSIDSDFLGRDFNFIENSRLFAEKRNIANKGKNLRLYVAEPSLSLTGSNADYRFNLNARGNYDFLAVIFNEFSQVKIPALNKNDLIKKYNLNPNKFEKLLKDIRNNKTTTLFTGGNSLSVEEHILLNNLNFILNNNTLIDYETAYQKSGINDENGIDKLIEKINSEKVAVLINYDTNPVFHIPGFDLNKLNKKLKLSISFVETGNETSALSDFVLPINHNFESWNDFNVRDGIFSTSQPVIQTIFKTRQKEGILLSWLTEKKYNQDDYRKYINDHFNSAIQPLLKYTLNGQDDWYKLLHDGFVEYKGTANNLTGSFNPGLTELKRSEPTDGFELLIRPSYFLADGKYINNGWLQEIPHPVSKVTWDNYAAVSKADADNLGLENDDLIEIHTENGKIKLPVIIQPGTAKSTILTEYGYGRTVTGEVGRNTGFNVFPLVKSNNHYNLRIKKVVKTGDKYRLISTQEHHAFDKKLVADAHNERKVVIEGTVKEYENDNKFLHKHDHKLFSISEEHEYKGNKWAMAIDLNKCIGCSVCVASCNVENNVPVVGKEQVGKGREMHWMRIDRYYSGNPENPEVNIQPMLCQHCDNAPCENVCPVNATNHSLEGLNQMVYNRCVGTRYCANNCPYKVRRYNFFNFRDSFAKGYYENELTALIHNPEVTVRSRGVMEKCTFCVQKIMDARAEAIKKGEPIKDGDVVTACQQACPTDAIVFGNVNDLKSKIKSYREHDLSYHILEQTNVKPNVTYLAKLRNTDMEDK